jgi:hypothetical protein
MVNRRRRAVTQAKGDLQTDERRFVKRPGAPPTVVALGPHRPSIFRAKLDAGVATGGGILELLPDGFHGGLTTPGAASAVTTPTQLYGHHNRLIAAPTS